MSPPNRQLIQGTKGFLDETEGRCLYDIASRACRLGPCLEIGSYCGKSSLYLGAACKTQGSVLFAIDHHCGSEEHQPGEAYFDPELFDVRIWQVDTYHQFRQTLQRAGLDDTVIPIVARSELVAQHWATPLGLVFIDGSHSYNATYADFASWSRHLVPGGYLLIHDIFPDPQQGGQAPYQVYLYALRSGVFQQQSLVKSLGVLRRR